MPGALEGIRFLEFSEMIAAPLAGMTGPAPTEPSGLATGAAAA